MSARKDEARLHMAEVRQESKERMEQQQYIQNLVSYIDERAAYYNRTKSIPIHQPYPKVDWTQINSYSKRNLPKAELLPVFGCPQYPDYYPDAPNPERIVVCSTTKDCSLPGCSHKTPIKGHPFGSLFGYKINLGLVVLPSTPVGGYIQTENEGWIHYTTPG